MVTEIQIENTKPEERAVAPQEHPFDGGRPNQCPSEYMQAATDWRALELSQDSDGERTPAAEADTTLSMWQGIGETYRAITVTRSIEVVLVGLHTMATPMGVWVRYLFAETFHWCPVTFKNGIPHPDLAEGVHGMLLRCRAGSLYPFAEVHTLLNGCCHAAWLEQVESVAAEDTADNIVTAYVPFAEGIGVKEYERLYDVLVADEHLGVKPLTLADLCKPREVTLAACDCDHDYYAEGPLFDARRLLDYVEQEARLDALIAAKTAATATGESNQNA